MLKADVEPDIAAYNVLLAVYAYNGQVSPRLRTIPGLARVARLKEEEGNKRKTRHPPVHSADILLPHAEVLKL